MPKKIYRYCPNPEGTEETTGKIVNYSMQALENNTVFMQTPIKFDDAYDSDLHMDYAGYEHFRLLEYCRRCGISTDTTQLTQDMKDALVHFLYSYITQNGTFEKIFVRVPDLEIERLANQWFVSQLTVALQKTSDIEKALAYTLQTEYNQYMLQ